MQQFSRLATALLCSTAAVLSTLAQADTPHYNQVSFSTEVSHEIAHDLMQVTLYSEAQNQDPAALAQEITRSINAGLEQAREVQGVQVSLGSRNSYPIYKDKGEQISAWHERAEIRLESSDFVALSKLTGEMLKTLQMGSMDFSIAKSTRQKEQDSLIKEAVAAFKQRAQLTTEVLGGKSYKLISLSFNNGNFTPLRARMLSAKSAFMDSASAVPEVEAGSSEVSLNAEGVIEVQMP